jgi:2'-5' RNA ligase
MRSFIAVKISPEQKQKLTDLIAQLRKTKADVKWVKPENLHVTLKFLGEVDEKLLPAIFEALDKALASSTSFELRLSALGCFPNLRRPRVVWVGIDKGGDELKAMVRMVEDAMAGLGFAREERGFSAHLTVGRVRDTTGIESLTNQLGRVSFVTDSCMVDEVIFFQSILKPEGPTYIPHKSVKLIGLSKEG